jgi:hypothetical protein
LLLAGVASLAVFFYTVSALSSIRSDSPLSARIEKLGGGVHGFAKVC